MHGIIFTYSRQNKAHVQYVCELARSMARVSFCAKRSVDQNDTTISMLSTLNQAKRGIAMDMLLQQWEGFSVMAIY